MSDKQNAQKLMEAATAAYGHKPSMAELTSFVLYEQAASNTSLNSVEASHSHGTPEYESEHNSTIDKANNALQPEIRDSVSLQESNLYAAAQRLEADMTNEFIAAVREGRYTEAEEILSESEEKRYVNEFKAALSAYFLILFPIYAKQLMSARAVENDKQGIFAMTDDVEQYIDDSARKAAESHVNTVKQDLVKSLIGATHQATEVALIELVRQGAEARESTILSKLPNNPNLEDITSAVKAGKFDELDIYKRARELAREGNGLDAITRQLKKEYQDISKNRARTIARHETNRVFNMAQYQADVQFLTESGLMANAYKRLRNRANDPCPVCAELVRSTNANPIPFAQNFADLGDTLTASYRKENGKMAVQKVPISYEAISAGNVHVNCRCEYELIIIQDDGTVLNEVDFRVHNAKGGNPYHDPKSGKFTTGTGGNDVSVGPKHTPISPKDQADYDEIKSMIGFARDGTEADSAVYRSGKQDEVESILKRLYPDDSYAAALDNVARGQKPKDKLDYTNGIYLYHGTNSEVGELKGEFSDSSSQTGVGQGHIFLTDNKDVARRYGEHIRTVKATVKNPLIIDANGNPWNEISYKGTNKSSNQWAIQAQKDGFDSLVVENVRDTGGFSSKDTPAGFTTSTTMAVFSDSTVKIVNKAGGNPYHDPRDGKFTSGTGSSSAIPTFKGKKSEAATKYINDYYGDTEYSDDELRVINDYTGSMFARMNRTLRGDSATHRISETGDKAAQTLQHINIMDKAMGKTHLKTDTTLWRAATSASLIKVGQKISDKGYGSTSMREEVADVFLGQNMQSSKKPVQYTLKINAKKGQTGIFVQNAKNNSYENEFILPHGSTYTVTKVKKFDGYYEVEADLS